jgi:hypothetical protein
LQRLFERVSTSLTKMRCQCVAAQSFDEHFIYAFNPLLRSPLVACSRGQNEFLSLPVPRYLLRRFTDGVHYDLVGTRGFDQAFGDSYQHYVGEVLFAANTSASLLVLPETTHFVGNDMQHSVDWIASDHSGELFIECKTKRLRLNAKLALADLAPLAAELSKVADFERLVVLAAREGIKTLWIRRRIGLASCGWCIPPCSMHSRKATHRPERICSPHYSKTFPTSTSSESARAGRGSGRQLKDELPGPELVCAPAASPQI